MPSSRLAKILQEKAESLKKRRLDAEQIVERAERRVRQLGELGVTLSETEGRTERIALLQRKSDWEAVEARARELLEYIDRTAGIELDNRRQALLATFDSLRAAEAPLPTDAVRVAEAVRSASVSAEFTELAGQIVTLMRVIRTGEGALVTDLQTKALALARWAGLAAQRFPEFEKRIAAAVAPAGEGAIGDALERLRAEIRLLVPAAEERRERSRLSGSGILQLARELGSPSGDLETALAHDATSYPTAWPQNVEAIERATVIAADQLRARVRQTIEALRDTVKHLEDHGAEPSEALGEIDEILGRVSASPPSELPGLLQGVREVAEDPVVGVVVSLLDEVRPRLVQARQLGRDPSEVFASMNRAREALRLKIYSEALAASKDALERVSQLTGDLDTTRDEAESLGSLVDRLGGFGVPVGEFRASLERANRELGRIEVDKARATMREAVRGLGRESTRYFTGRIQQLATLTDVARERGFLPTGTLERLAQARHQVDDGALPEAGELLARVDSELRAAAGPYVSRRVEEIQKSFGEIVDPQLTATTRRFLADADVSLRVKEELGASLEALKRAEHEFTLVYAAHAATLVERVGAQQHLLDEMGGAGAEMQRQIDEVQQIFNMGDFPKASHAAQEILHRIRQQQTVRSDEAISHAKLALVELSQMGLDVAALRERFDAAQEAARGGLLLDAFKGASAVETEATEVRNAAQTVLDQLALVTARAEELKAGSPEVDALLARTTQAREAYLARNFEGAAAQLSAVSQALEAAFDANEARRYVSEARELTEDARRLAVPTEEIEARTAQAQAALDAGKTHEAIELARENHRRLVGLVKPVAAEHLKALEQDVEIARDAKLELTAVVEALGEARRRLVAPIPVGVAERIETARAELMETRGLLEHAELVAKRVREAYAQAEILHLATPELYERVEALDREIARRRYTRVIEAAGAIERELIQTTNHHVARTIAGLQGTIVQARQEGSPTAVAENLLGLGRQALNDGHPMEALQLAARAEGEVERFGLQTRLARGAVETLEAKITRLEGEGIRVPRATEFAVRARDAIEHRRFVDGLELALDAHDSIAASRESFRRARETLDAADRQVKEAMEFGADIAEVVGILEQARRHGQVGEYAEASVRAHEAADLSRWAIERLYAGSLAQVRGLAETMRVVGIEASGPVTASLEEAEVALQAKEWKRAGDLLDRARSFAVASLDRLVDRRSAQLDEQFGDLSGAGQEVLDERERWKGALAEARERRDYARAFELIKEEEGRAIGSSRAALERRLDELKQRLWIGERLGLDTTPVMERFSEARMALSKGDLPAVPKMLDAGTAHLEGQIEEQMPRRAKQLETELIFARDGLHIALGNLEERIGSARRLAQQHEPIEAARALLAVEEDLNQRKVLHRELTNLHYLIGAALQRAAERELDTAEARTLLEGSIVAQETDYADAVARARQALKLLEAILQETQAPAAFWPFHRPKSG